MTIKSFPKSQIQAHPVLCAPRSVPRQSHLPQLPRPSPSLADSGARSQIQQPELSALDGAPPNLPAPLLPSTKRQDHGWDVGRQQLRLKELNRAEKAGQVTRHLG